MEKKVGCSFTVAPSISRPSGGMRFRTPKKMISSRKPGSPDCMSVKLGGISETTHTKRYVMTRFIGDLKFQFLNIVFNMASAALTTFDQ